MPRFLAATTLLSLACDPGASIPLAPKVAGDAAPEAPAAEPDGQASSGGGGQFAAPALDFGAQSDLDFRLPSLEEPDFGWAPDLGVAPPSPWDAGPPDVGFDAGVTPSACEGLVCEPVRDVPYSCQEYRNEGEEEVMGMCFPDFRGMHFHAARIHRVLRAAGGDPAQDPMALYLETALQERPPLLVFMRPRRGQISAPVLPELYFIQGAEAVEPGRYRGVPDQTAAVRLAPLWPDPEGFPRGADIPDDVPVASFLGMPFDPATREPIAPRLLIGFGSPEQCPVDIGPVERLGAALAELADVPVSSLFLNLCVPSTLVVGEPAGEQPTSDWPADCASTPGGEPDGHRFQASFELTPVEFRDEPTRYLAGAGVCE